MRATENTLEPSRSSETRVRLLQVAEELFSAQGIDRTSMRELTAAAGVNVAAVNYHFRSKEQLIEELLASVSMRVNQQRREGLKQYLQDCQRQQTPPKIEALVDIFIDPYVDPQSDSVARLLAQLILQHRLHPTEVSQRIVAEHFDPMAQEYIVALSQTEIELPPVEWYWRYLFMVSTVVFMISDNAPHNRLVRLSEGAASTSDKEHLRHYLRQFLVGGLTAAPESFHNRRPE